MKRSQLFTKVSKTVPSDEVSKNAQLLIQAGFVHKQMAGVYAYLPLGWRVMQKIMQVIREEMNAIGSSEIIMTSLQPKETWEQTDRWDDEKVDVWFKSELKNGTEVGLAWSHEEPITTMMKDYIASYRDLPVYVYQFQNKLRNELRAKSGIMRCREFIMKDLYSYSINEAQHEEFYQRVSDTYLKIFERVGLGEVTFLTFASGGAFTQFSHEFQTICDAGEDIIYVNHEKKIAINKEVLTDEVMQQLGVTRDELEEVKAAEVGNIFNFGTTKSEQIGLYYNNEAGEKVPVFLGSYGIGISRLMGVMVERFSDDRGIVWPEEVAPYTVQIIPLAKSQDEAAYTEAVALYEKLTAAGVEVLFDDRIEMSPGAKFAEHDLMGIPYRVVVSAKTLDAGKVEWKKRTEAEFEMISTEEALQRLGA
jgi:prolyl-tRNA synthetase